MLLGQLGFILYLINLPTEIVSQLTFPRDVQLILGVAWLILFAWGMIGWVKGKIFRAVWLICGFIIYSLLQLVIFSQADYDRQREPFLLVVIGFVLILIIATNYKENFTND